MKVEKLMKKVFLVGIIVIVFSTLLTISVFATSEVESNNSAKTATEISVNSTISGNLSSSDDEDWFKVIIPQDGVISIDFKHDNLYDDRYYWAIALFHSDGSTHVSEGNTVYVVKGNKDRELPEFGVSAGTYYVQIKAWDVFSSSNYNFQVVYTESATYEKENNNNAQNATVINPNITYSGAINQDDDVDWYKVIIMNDGVISVDFKHENLFDEQYFWSIELYHSDGTSQISDSNTRYVVKGNADRVLPEFGVSAGTYYVKIYSYSDDCNTSTYSFSITHRENDCFESETNNTYKKATSIEFGKRYYGAINASSDVDWYKVILTTDMTFLVSFDHKLLESESDYWYLEFYKSDGTTYVNDNNVRYYIKGNANRILPEISVTAGTYYIKIYAGEVDLSTYSFSIAPKHDCTGSFTTVKNPTCAEAGVQEKYCTICGTLLETQSVAANGHTCDNWIIDVEATCSSEGGHHGICGVCGETVSEKIPMIAHSVGEWSVILEPTCHGDGTRTRECSECDYFETETLSALTHEFGDWSVAEAPTCGQAGVEKRTCSLCGDIEEQQLEQLTHEYGEWIVISGSKLIPPIVREKTCELCGNTETVKDWSNVWITILVGIALIGVTIGIINYIVSIKKAQKRK